MQDGRWVHHLHVARDSWTGSMAHQTLQLCRHSQRREEALVGTTVGGSNSYPAPAVNGGSSSRKSSKGRYVRANSANAEAPKPYGFQASICYEQKIRDIPTSPIQSVCHTAKWKGDFHGEPSTTRYVNGSDRNFVNSCYAVQDDLCKMTVAQFIEYYTHTMPLFANIYEKPDFYYSPLKSLKICEALLTYQLGSDGIVPFVNDLLNVVDRRVPKRNTLYVIGEPSAGKNFFFDAIKDFFLNSGEVALFNRNNAFPLNNAVCRRIIMCNEPSFDDYHFEDLKKLFGGDSMNARVKHQNDKTLLRTPVIMLSNRNVLRGGGSVWTDRISSYNWHSCPALKNYSRKPHPLMFILLLQKYCTDKKIVQLCNKWNKDKEY